jgi:hypothetical protein
LKDTCYLLFTETDFENIESSQIYSDLKGASLLIDSMLLILIDYLKTSQYLELKPFTDYLLPPKILTFKANKDVVLEGVEVEFSWSIENAVSVKIEPEIGIVPKNGTHTFKPQNQSYRLIAEGHFENVEMRLELKLFPTPLIETIFVPAPKMNEITNLQIQFPKFPQIDISINNIQTGVNINEQNIHYSLPSFNLVSFKTINLEKVVPKIKWIDNLNKLLSKVSKIKS